MAQGSARSDGRASRFRMLADETKIRLIEALAGGPKSVTELVRLLKIRQPLVSHHLQGLKEHGVAASERVGKAVVYRLADGVKCAGSKKTLELGCCRVELR